MTDSETLTVEEIHARWSDFVQSPAQLAFSRLLKFPPGSGPVLAEILGIKPGDLLLEVGSGLGLLASRLMETGKPSAVCALEPGDRYHRFRLPDSLQPGARPTEVRGDGFRLPLPDSTVDQVLTHTLVNLLDTEGWDRLHDEVRRVLKPSGRVTHMDGIGGSSWKPGRLERPAEERERREKFFELLRGTHDQLGTGFVDSVKDLPARLQSSGFRNIRVDSYASTFFPDDPDWSDRQRRDLLNLRKKADLGRIERLRNLLERTRQLDEQRRDLLEHCLNDARRQAERRRTVFDEGWIPGWRSSTTLIGTGECRS